MAIDLRKQLLDQKQSELSTSAQAKADALKARNAVKYNPLTGQSQAYKDANAAYKNASTEYTKAKNASDTEKQVAADEAALMSDINVAENNVDSVLGDAGNLGRIREDASVVEAQNAYKNATDLSLQRDQATRQLQAAEGSQSRQLASALAASGVKGGAAGAAFTDLASMNLRNRANLEQDLAVQNVAANKERAQFETQLAQFDLGQSNAEKNLRLQTKLGLAQASQNSRSAAASKVEASNIGSSGGSSGTVLCTAMYHHGLINKDDFFYDVMAGKKLLFNKKTRKAFMLYNKVCKPIANFAIRHRWFALLISPIIVPIARSFNDKNRLGKALFAILSIPFKLAAKVL